MSRAVRNSAVVSITGYVDEDTARCSWPDCEVTFEDQGYLTDMTVSTSPGEEGYAEVVQLFCQHHYEHVAAELAKLGFVSHNHHGTNLLDAHNGWVPVNKHCGGYGECPYDVEYGFEIVTQDGPIQPWNVPPEDARANQLEATIRLIGDSDITPAGRRVLQSIVEQWREQ